MKITLLITFFLVLAITSYSQQNHHSKPLSYEDYIQKSKNQRDLGFTLLGVGAVAIIIPVIVISSSSDPSYAAESDISAISMGLGAVMIISSVPILYFSVRNKEKAMSLSFKNESSPQIVNSNIVSRPVPSLSLKIGL